MANTPDESFDLEDDWNKLVQGDTSGRGASDAEGTSATTKTPPPRKRTGTDASFSLPSSRDEDETRKIYEAHETHTENDRGRVAIRLPFPNEEIFWSHLGIMERADLNELRRPVLRGLALIVRQDRPYLHSEHVQITDDSVVVNVAKAMHDSAEPSPGETRPQATEKNVELEKSLISGQVNIRELQKNWYRNYMVPGLRKIAELRCRENGFGDEETQWVSKNWLIVSLEGSGGNGVVFRALNFNIGQLVALKVVPLQERADEKPAERLFLAKQESRVQAEVPHHPNIVAVYDSYYPDSIGPDSVGVIVMEWVHGEDLDTRANLELTPQRRHFSLLDESGVGERRVPGVLSIMEDLLKALQKLYELKIIHRDLKLANILVAKDGTTKLADFGISLSSRPFTSTQMVRLSTFMTKSGSLPLVGTLAFLCPHYSSSNRPHPLTDIWGAGVVFYMLVAGLNEIGRRIQPYHVSSIADFVQFFRSDSHIPSLGTHRPDLPPALVSKLDEIILEGMLQVDAHDRSRPRELLAKVQEVHQLLGAGFFSDVFPPSGQNKLPGALGDVRKDIGDILQ